MDDLCRAMRNATEGIELSEPSGRVSYVPAGRLVLARVHLAREDVDGATGALHGAESLAEEYDYAFLRAELAGLRARLCLTRANLDEASRRAQERIVRQADDPGLALAREAEAMAGCSWPKAEVAKCSSRLVPDVARMKVGVEARAEVECQMEAVTALCRKAVGSCSLALLLSGTLLTPADRSRPATSLT